MPRTRTRGGAELGIEYSPTLTCNHEAPIAAYSIALRGRDGGATTELGDEVAGCLRASGGGGDKAHVLAFSCKDNGRDATIDLSPTLRSMNSVGSNQNAGGQMAVMTGMIVRRLIPSECEILQGFSKNYTLVPKGRKMLDDGSRYRVLGNSMCVNVVNWIGERIQRFCTDQSRDQTQQLRNEVVELQPVQANDATPHVLMGMGKHAN